MDCNSRNWPFFQVAPVYFGNLMLTEKQTDYSLLFPGEVVSSAVFPGAIRAISC